MGTEMKNDFSDEEDLDALRLAALSSLKKKNEQNGFLQNQHFPNEKNYGYNKAPFRGGKRRFFLGQAGRSRNSQFNNPVRNSNLISIPTVNNEIDISEPGQKSSSFMKKEIDVPKLIRPQDRYASTINAEVESEGPSSKFDRYDNSNSESEEEDEVSSTNLGRSDSLEALMEELDAEIQGEPKKEKKEKVKIKREIKIAEEPKEMVMENINENKVEESETEQNNEIIPKLESEESLVCSASLNLEESITFKNDGTKQKVANSVDKTNIHQNQRSPGQRKISNRRLNGRIFNSEPPFVPILSNPIVIPNASFVNSIQPPQFTTVYNTVPSYTGPEVFPLNVPPPTFVPPPALPSHVIPLDIPPAGYNVSQLPPLVIEPSTSLSSIPMGPLSPRSAAFVLQNRAIVEKRKRSPRRSYSRSPSPPQHRLRYSKSPPLRRSLTPSRRSLTPLRRSFSPSRRSVSPRRSPLRRSLSPYRRHRDKSPRRDSPRRSPRRTRDSPIRSPKRSKDSPKRIKDSRRTPIKDRLGARTKNDEKDNKKDGTVSSPSRKEDIKPLNPILEARKRKFESKEMKVKEGVIRLKPKEVQKIKDEEIPTKIKAEKKIEENKANMIVIEKVKKEIAVKTSTKEESSTRIVLLPKNEDKVALVESPKRDQLEEAMNELEMLLKDDEALELTAKVDDLFTDEETDQENEGRFKVKKNATNDAKSTRKLVNGAINKIPERRRDIKPKWNFEETKKDTKSKAKKEPLTNPIENRKIEIKIRNPGKYEKNGSKIQSSIKVSSARKVELGKKEEYSGDETEPEIVVENEDEDNGDNGGVTASREGDLRAQLSRKRAERQNKQPTVEGFQSRLLQSALEGAVFKKKKSKKKDKEAKDVKLPIHLRLGIAHDSDIFAEAATEKISRKKSKKRKHATVEQV